MIWLVQFSNIKLYILQGSVATCFRCSGIFNYIFMANFPGSPPVKEFWKFAEKWQSYRRSFAYHFLRQCITLRCLGVTLCAAVKPCGETCEQQIGPQVKYKQGRRVYGYILGAGNVQWRLISADTVVYKPIGKWSKVPFQIDEDDDQLPWINYGLNWLTKRWMAIAIHYNVAIS